MLTKILSSLLNQCTQMSNSTREYKNSYNKNNKNNQNKNNKMENK